MKKKVNILFLAFIIGSCLLLIYITRVVDSRGISGGRSGDAPEIPNLEWAERKGIYLDVSYAVFFLIYIGGLAWYVKNFFNTQKATSMVPKPLSPTIKQKTPKKKSRRRRKGKRCPQCRKIIDCRRIVCRHCGYEFKPEPGLEPHADKINGENHTPPAEMSDERSQGDDS